MFLVDRWTEAIGVEMERILITCYSYSDSAYHWKCRSLNASVKSHVQLQLKRPISIKKPNFFLYLLFITLFCVLLSYSFPFHYKILRMKVNFEPENHAWNTKSVKWPWQFCSKWANRFWQKSAKRSMLRWNPKMFKTIFYIFWLEKTGNGLWIGSYK